MEIKFKYIIKNKHTGQYYNKWYTLSQIEEKGLNGLFDLENYDIIAKCQFTGQKDFKGVDIYSDDIVKTHEDWELYGMQAGEINQIYFAYGGFRLKPKNERAKGFYLEDGSDVIIIGSIHTNPELIK